MKQKSIQYQNMGKVDFHSTGKAWWKQKHFKFVGFLNISGEAEIHTIPKIWEKWVSIVREKNGKTQTFQVCGFLKYFGWSRNPYNSQSIGKMNLLSTGKVWENTEISHILRYLAYLKLMRTYAIPNIWECGNSHKMELWVSEETRSYYETQVIHRVWVM